MTIQTQAFSTASDNVSYCVSESCCTTVHPVSLQKHILSADNAGFKPKTGFTTEKHHSHRNYHFHLRIQILTIHPVSQLLLFHSCETGCKVVKQDSGLYNLNHSGETGFSDY